MLKALIDTNVLISAAYKSTGRSRELISRAVKGEFQPYVANRSLLSARLRLEQIAPERVDTFDKLIMDLIPRIIKDPTEEEILKHAGQAAKPSDVYIVAAAIAYTCQYIVTWNTKDCLQDKIKGVKIVNPHEFIEILNTGKNKL